MGFFLPTTGHTTMWGGNMWSARGAGARLTISFSQEYVSVPPATSYAQPVKGKRMRVVFNLEIKAEIPSYDTKQREVFVRLMTEAAKRLYTQAALMSGAVSPDMNVTVDSGGKREDIELFKGEQVK